MGEENPNISENHGANSDEAALRRHIRGIPDFPKEGILFRDVTPLLLEPKVFTQAIEALAKPFLEAGIERVLGIESRGFIFGAPVAQRLEAGFGLIRKAGKLPFDTRKVEYNLEYGTDAVEMHIDTILPGQRVLLVDDLVATGGTAAAAETLVHESGGELVGAAFLIELAGLNGRDRLSSPQLHSVIRY
jgi:adenine phosphoribosyltransferase